jgi:hypothetical protein
MVISIIDLFLEFNPFKTEGFNIFICDLVIECLDLVIKFFKNSILSAILQVRNNLLCQTHSQLKQ